MTLREAMLRVMLRWARKGRGEIGANNAGWFVEMLQRADLLPGEIYAWCQDAVNAAHRLSTGGRIVRRRGGGFDIEGGKMLANGTASVGLFLQWADQLRYVVAGKPARGDCVCFHRAPGDWPYHVGMIVSARTVGPLCYLSTVEGNTSPDADVSDPGTGRDGIFAKRRIVRRSLVSIVRIPGEAVEPAPSKRKRAAGNLRAA